jgi:hypothetical protein
MQTRTPPRDLEGIHKLLTERIIYGWLEDSPAVALTAAKLAELKAQITFLAEALCDDDFFIDMNRAVAERIEALHETRSVPR